MSRTEKFGRTSLSPHHCHCNWPNDSEGRRGGLGVVAMASSSSSSAAAAAILAAAAATLAAGTATRDRPGTGTGRSWEIRTSAGSDGPRRTQSGARGRDPLVRASRGGAPAPRQRRWEEPIPLPSRVSRGWAGGVGGPGARPGGSSAAMGAAPPRQRHPLHAAAGRQGRRPPSGGTPPSVRRRCPDRDPLPLRTPALAPAEILANSVGRSGRLRCERKSRSNDACGGLSRGHSAVGASGPLKFGRKDSSSMIRSGSSWVASRKRARARSQRISCLSSLRPSYDCPQGTFRAPGGRALNQRRRRSHLRRSRLRLSRRFGSPRRFVRPGPQLASAPDWVWLQMGSLGSGRRSRRHRIAPQLAPRQDRIPNDGAAAR
jgi:hypothetical protein